jgi:menaquinone-dependent protoporphyrinogen oxidase
VRRPVLVGYASAAGATRGVAERIAVRLRAGGVPVTCAPLSADLDPDDHEAWVVGSAVHGMAWLPAAAGFLQRAAAVPARPCWVFSVGGLAPTGAFRRWLGRQEVRRIEQGFPAGLPLRDHRLFAGVVAVEGMNRAGRAFWRGVGGRPGDQRDWAAIDRWADGVADQLTGPPSPGPPRGVR